MREAVERWALRAVWVFIALTFAASMASLIAGLLIAGGAVFEWAAS